MLIKGLQSLLTIVLLSTTLLLNPLAAQLRFEGLVFQGLGKPFLDNASSVTFSPNGDHIYVSSYDDQAITVFQRDELTGEVTLIETQKNNIDGVEGLNGSYQVLVSPDGKHVYATGQLDHSVVFFDRDQNSGKLTYRGAYKDNENGIDGLQGAFLMDMSPDGNYLYVTGSYENALTVFTRNVITGTLTPNEIKKDGQAGLENMNTPMAVKVSPDGAQVFVTSFGDNSLVVFNRSKNTGRLNYVESYENGTNGVSGLGGAHGLDISPDGQNIYVTGSDESSLAMFTRYPGSSTIIYSGKYKNGTGEVSGLSGATAVTTSPDGTYVYVAGSTEDAIVVFSRNQGTGQLTFVEKMENGVNGVSAMDFPTAIAVSKDIKDIYVTGFASNSLTSFKRDLTNGTLDFKYSEQGNNQGVQGIKGATSINQSPDGQYIYVAGEQDDALAVFERNFTTGELSFVERIEDGNGVDGLNGVKAINLSSDGKFVYAAGFWDNSVAAFSRNEDDGTLTYIDRYKDGLFGVDGLGGTNDIILSRDQNHLYATGFWDSGIALFERNSVTGELDFITSYTDGSNGIDGLASVTGITVTPDGNHIYAAGNGDNAISIFSRNTTDGSLTYVGLVQDGLDEVEGLKGIKKLRVSPEGNHLYAVSEVDNALVHFTRDQTSGMLTFTGFYQNGSEGGQVQGLEGATDVQISENGEYVYVTAAAENSITAFQRDLETGILTFEQTQRDGEGDANGIGGASSVSVSQDGRYIYASGAEDNAIALFSCTYVYDVTEQICQGESVEVGGEIYSEPGVYNDVIEEESCIKIINLNLSVQTTEVVVNAQICAGDAYEFDDLTLTVNGEYTAIFTSSLGCDSTVVLNLEVVDEFSPTILNKTICQGDTYYLNGSAFAETGEYEEILISSFGCDSTVQLNLTVKDPMQTNLQETICEGEFYVIGTTNYHENGTFSHTLQNAHGCDSIVNLSLIVIPTTAILNEVICEGDTYILGDLSFTEAGTYVETVTTSGGCALNATLNLEVMPALIVEGNIIEDTGNGLGAVELNIEGGMGPYEIEWSNGANQTSIDNLVPGVYSVVVIDALNCMQELTFFVNVTTSTDDLTKNTFAASIWPNPAPKNQAINLSLELATNQQIEVRMMNAIGEQIQKEAFNLPSGAQQLTLQTPNSAGFYFVQISNREGQQQTLRLVIP